MIHPLEILTALSSTIIVYLLNIAGYVKIILLFIIYSIHIYLELDLLLLSYYQ